MKKLLPFISILIAVAMFSCAESDLDYLTQEEPEGGGSAMTRATTDAPVILDQFVGMDIYLYAIGSTLSPARGDGYLHIPSAAPYGTGNPGVATVKFDHNPQALTIGKWEGFNDVYHISLAEGRDFRSTTNLSSLGGSFRYRPDLYGATAYYYNTGFDTYYALPSIFYKDDIGLMLIGGYYIGGSYYTGNFAYGIGVTPDNKLQATPHVLPTTRWKIVPAGYFVLERVEYVLEPGDWAFPIADFVDEAIVNNGTPERQELTLTFQNKAAETSNFSESTGASVQVSRSAKIGLPKIFGNNEVSITETTADNWNFTQGGSETHEDTRTYSFKLNVAPHSSYRAVCSVARYEANVTYIATYTHTTTGRTIKLRGKWNGRQLGLITYDIIDMSGVRVASFTDSPQLRTRAVEL